MEKNVSSYISRGWILFKGEWQFFVVAMLLMAGISVFDGIFGVDGVQGDSVAVTLITQITYLILSVGMISVCLDVARDKPATYTRFFTGFTDIRLVVFYLLGSILSFIVVLTGIIALVIPGIIAMVRVSMTQQVLVDTGCGPIDAIKKSFALTKGYFWFIMLFGFMAVLINILGVLALGIGLVVTIPLTTLAFISFYLDRHDAHNTAPQS